jgi:17beta-estradiol 17-dehydrogenase / very-long-chain 3-oxoacyl-CoA reductase
MGCCVACVGWFAIVYLAIRLAFALYNLFYPYMIAKRFGLLRNLNSFGSWAVVTGATDGIGKAYAELLAKRGFKVVLIGRNPEKLLSTSADITKINSNVEIRTVVADFGSSDLSLYDKIEDSLRDLDIGVLVNNVGVGNDHPEYFTEFPGGSTAISNMLNVNCLAGTMMCWKVLPGMVERKRGAIINVSSFSGTFPMPLLSVYSATKAYLDFFFEIIKPRIQI